MSMDTDNENLNRKIMRRIWIVYFLRRVWTPLLRKIYVLAGLFFAVTSLVSLPNVIANLPQEGLRAIGTFLWNALINAEFAVQMLTIGMVVWVSLLVRDILIQMKPSSFA